MRKCSATIFWIFSMVMSLGLLADDVLHDLVGHAQGDLVRR